MILSTFFHHILQPVRRGTMTPQECAEFCLSLGITGIDVMPCAPVREPEDILQIFLQSGMCLCSMPAHWDILHGADPGTADTVLKTAERLGVRNVLIIPGFFEDGDDRSEVVARSLEPFAAFCRRAASMGITPAMESFDHVASPLLHTEGLLYYLSQIPELTCTFDMGNAYYSGEDVTDAFRRLRPYIKEQIHCKDRLPPSPDAAWEQGSPRPTPDTAVGDGVVPIASILHELTADGFDGVISLEHYGAEDQAASLTRSAAYVRNVLRQDQ